MGLSFHYSGRFDPTASLAEMILEVEEIAKANQWDYHVFERSFPEKDFDEKYNSSIYGMCFTPPGCETVHLEFLSNGKMSSSTHLQFFGNSDREDHRKYLYMLSVKTQYAGREIHIRVLKVLKHISKKYLLGFELYDEGNYWKTEDEGILDENFRRYELLIERFKAALETSPVIEGETIEEYLVRIAEQARKDRR
jgi:hypothetical protein